MQKKVYVEETLEEAIKPTPSKLDDDLLFRLAKKVIRVKPMTQIPSWIMDLPIPPNTIESELNAFECYNKLCSMRKEMKSLNHPVYTIDNLLAVSDVRIDNCKMIYNDNGNVKVINSNKSYYIEEVDNEFVTVAAAYVADVVPYYSRYDPVKNDASTSLSDRDVKQLALKEIDTTWHRAKYSFEYSSETKARDIIFERMIKKPDIALVRCSELASQNDSHSLLNKTATNFMAKWIKDNKLSVKPMPIYFPKLSEYKIPRSFNKTDNEAIDIMYNYLLRSRSFRGNDKGIGVLTFSYLLGMSVPRAVIKYITLFLDLRQLMVRYNVKILLINGKISEMVMRMLVANGYFVVSTTCGETRILTDAHVTSEAFGIYSSMKADQQYGIYYEVESKPASLSGKIVLYTTVDVDGVFRMTYGAAEKICFKALRAHISPELPKEYAFYPCALAHNGQVIVATPKVAEFDLPSLANRCSMANFLRNNYFVLRVPWIVRDIYMSDVGYCNSFIIPKIKRKTKENAYDYSVDMEEVKDITDIEVEQIPRNLTSAKEKKEYDPDIVLKSFFLEAEKSNDFSMFTETLIKHWGLNTAPVSAKALFKANPTWTAFIALTHLEAAYPDETEEIASGRHAAADYFRLKEARARSENDNVKQDDITIPAEQVQEEIKPVKDDEGDLFDVDQMSDRKSVV